MKFLLEIELGNDAMSTVGHVAEALRRLSRTMVEYQDEIPEADLSFNIHDCNGNSVGKAVVK